MPQKRAIVLSGGGARGAYEVGVLSYLFSELPKELLAKAKIHLLCGTSVGAIHACYLAAAAENADKNIRGLEHLWLALRGDEMLRLSLRDLLRLPSDIRTLFRKSGTPPGVVVNSALLSSVISARIPWQNIRRNLHRSHLEAVTTTATHIHSGRTVVFVDTHDGALPVLARDPRISANLVQMGPNHALASAAIPFLFPPVFVGGSYYCDGGLRQNTPLSPALRLGATKVLVIALRHHNPGAPAHPPPQPDNEESFPGPFMMLGKVMNALLLDHLDYDLSRLLGFNTLLRDGRAAFGPGFDEGLNEIAKRMRGASYREVQTVVVRPSQDIGAMATAFIHNQRHTFGALRGTLLAKLSSKDVASQSDFLSYMLFDGRFARELIALGRADAHAERDKLMAFLTE